MANPLIDIQNYGQSVWYDYIRRGLITSGELARMIEQDGLMGVTSNPSIFEKALVGSSDYDQALSALVADGIGNAKDIYERLAVDDIQRAADVMHPVWVRTGGRDGFVSLEVSPYLAHDTAGTVEEALRLHAAVSRPNVMIKVPATAAGIPAVQRLIAVGLCINVTLLFALEMYEQVVEAYISGLQERAGRGEDVAGVASVASFFISRIDSLIDSRLSQELDGTRDAERRARLKSLVGKVAIANAKITYARCHELYASERWQALAARGARPQRLLWASTSTKNPKYSPTMYVDALIGPDTVNTMPAETFDAFRATGRAQAGLTDNWAEGLAQARSSMATLAEVGISMEQATAQLLEEGVQKFSEAFDKLLGAVEKKRQKLLGPRLAQQSYSIGSYAAAVEAKINDWRAQGNVRRLWQGDPTLWTRDKENAWVGWLHVVDGQQDHPEYFHQVVDDVRGAGFRTALVLGMGGSSLCPEVLRRTWGVIPGFPELLVLDSTVPAQIKAFEAQIDVSKTLFIVSSKSGTTIEPNSFMQYFLDKTGRIFGEAAAGTRFIAITDPGTPLHDFAKKHRFRHIAHGVPSIGGRYSALSHFGMIPAAVMGIDVLEFLDRAEIMVQSCAAYVPPESNPGVMLGIILGTLGNAGRDKVTFVTSPGISSLGAWLEQLIAESTGKESRREGKRKGLVPVDNEPLGAPGIYGTDRVFAYIRLSSAPSAEQDDAVAALEQAGHPVVRIALEDPMDLGQEFFRWEIATATAGAILAINPFDQPDVESAKIAARGLMKAYEETGKLAPQTPLLEADGLALFADTQNEAALAKAARSRDVPAYLAAHLARIRPGDYFAINAFVSMDNANARELEAIRHVVRDNRRVATTLGFGPRFLHSTGQLHKGGPNSGVFLEITCDDAEDLAIPGQHYQFGILKRAQELGDFQVLAEKERRILRVHVGTDVHGGLARLREIISRIS